MDKPIELLPYQKRAVRCLRSGSVLKGGVGSGKSVTSIAFYLKNYGFKKTPLYIITTAKKRDSAEWEDDLRKMGLDCKKDKICVDSWNNITKYENITGCVFLFDEQKAIGSGAWAKTFIKIAQSNDWLLLTATPGDEWKDYIPIFVAKGYYKNRTDFIRNHIVYKRFMSYPVIDRYLGEMKLERLRKETLVEMSYESPHKLTPIFLETRYRADYSLQIMRDRWNVYKDEPIQTASEYCACLRRLVNSDPSRIDKVREILSDHPKAIIFYNFDYELEILRSLSDSFDVTEWNGHKHEKVSDADAWVYLVQYTAGNEAWNCIKTDTMIFYSLNYSYKITKQAAGRIDRVNSPYQELFYFFLKSNHPIESRIMAALGRKKKFNEDDFYSQKLHGF